MDRTPAGLDHAGANALRVICAFQDPLAPSSSQDRDGTLLTVLTLLEQDKVQLSPDPSLDPHVRRAAFRTPLARRSS